MSNSILRIKTRELATILNALRNFQIQENAVIDEYFEDVDGGRAQRQFDLGAGVQADTDGADRLFDGALF